MASGFENIYHGLSAELGKLKIANSGFGWKPNEDEGDGKAIYYIGSSDIKWFQWLRVARNFQLRVGLKGEKGKRRDTFDGFKAEDYDKLQNLTRQCFDLPIEVREFSARGWNWGNVEVESSDIAFYHSGQRLAFEIPIEQVHNTSIAKQEVTIEFANDEPVANGDAKGKKKSRKAPDEIVEIRFFIPGTSKKKREGSEAGGTEGSDNEEQEDGEELSAAQTFHDLIKDRAEIGRVTGEGIVTLPDILCLTPRGRFDIDLCSNFLRTRGKTYDYKILYSSVKKVYLLPKPDGIHVQLVVNLDPPIRQGQTRYPYLVMQFAEADEMEASLNLSEEDLKEKYNGLLQKNYQKKAHEVVSTLLKVLTGKKITTTGNSFQSRDGQAAVKCHLKANEGQLYFLDKSMLFISKQPMNVPHTDIASVHFSRVGGVMQSSKTFDLQIHMRNASAPTTFSNVSKDEKQQIEDHLRGKNIKVKNEMAEDAGAASAAMAAALLDDEDEDMGSDSAPARVNADEDSDEEDEDFKADSDESDVNEEFDENYQGGSSDSSDAAMSDNESPPKTSKKNKKADSDSDEAPARKKQKN
ncbi:SSrecog-domain-containing protein [Atractiella rhizophila]|nr:SSrecog-domain-containing protein [Atractiella rhizophila]